MRTLLLMAGYPGVGKSTLLTRALSEGLAPFGDSDDAYFRSVRLPPRFPESMLPARELLDCGTWFAQHDIPFLAALERLPEVVLIHIDLICMFSLFGDSMVRAGATADVLEMLPPSHQTLADRSKTASMYRHLLSLGFFQRFDRRVVNTIHAPWSTIAQRWHEREVMTNHRWQTLPNSRFVRKHVLNPQRPRQDIYRGVYGGWLDALDAWRPDLSLTTEVLDDRITSRVRPAIPGERGRVLWTASAAGR